MLGASYARLYTGKNGRLSNKRLIGSTLCQCVSYAHTNLHEFYAMHVRGDVHIQQSCVDIRYDLDHSDAIPTLPALASDKGAAVFVSVAFTSLVKFQSKKKK